MVSIGGGFSLAEKVGTGLACIICAPAGSAKVKAETDSKQGVNAMKKIKIETVKLPSGYLAWYETPPDGTKVRCNAIHATREMAIEAVKAIIKHARDIRTPEMSSIKIEVARG